MEIIFDDHHKVAQGDRTKLSPYSYCYDYNLKLSQLAVCITGTPEYILDKLKKMVSEIEERGKPLQGQIVTREGFSSEVITPVWNIVPKQEDDGAEVKKSRTINIEVARVFDIPEAGSVAIIEDAITEDINTAIDVEDTITENPPYAG
jgi:hypothetical protein